MNFTEMAILQVLMEGPAFGLQVIERIHTRTMDRIMPAQGSIYPLMQRMENDGLLVVTDVEQGGAGGRPRIYYALTRAGLKTAKRDRAAMLQLFGGKK